MNKTGLPKPHLRKEKNAYFSEIDYFPVHGKHENFSFTLSMIYYCCFNLTTSGNHSEVCRTTLNPQKLQDDGINIAVRLN